MTYVTTFDNENILRESTFKQCEKLEIKGTCIEKTILKFDHKNARQ